MAPDTHLAAPAAALTCVRLVFQKVEAILLGSGNTLCGRFRACVQADAGQKGLKRGRQESRLEGHTC